MCLTLQMSLPMSCYMSHDMFLQSAFQFGFLSNPCLFPLKSSLEFVFQHVKPKFISLPVQFLANAGCKENHFYSLPFGQADVISTSPKNILTSRINVTVFCYSNSSKNITCPLGKLKTEFTTCSPIAKLTSSGLSDTTFFAR